MKNFLFFTLLIVLISFSESKANNLVKEKNQDSTFADILNYPDKAILTTDDESVNMVFDGKKFNYKNIDIKFSKKVNGLTVLLSSTTTPIKYLKLHWTAKFPTDWKYLSDSWERSYGDLQWKAFDTSSIMPWYFFVSNKSITHSYGVMTSPSAICGWMFDSKGVTLILDVRNGGMGVQLGQRELNVCTIVSRKGNNNESVYNATRAFCKQMCPNPRVLKYPIYGFNDWYCDYGKNSEESVKWYANYIVKLSPKGKNRPFMVVDDGWQTGGGNGSGGPWDYGNENFPSMKNLSKEINKAGAKSGIWIRLLTAQNQPKAWRMQNNQKTLDPSNPDVLDYVKQLITTIKSWGFELLKHDYSTFDINGTFKSAAAEPSATWTFADRTRTTAEITKDFYHAIREAAGDDMLVMGCTTVGHLSAGVFDISRIGDDTSGKDWDRVLKMGVNTLAFRSSQNGSFYAVDADCVGLTGPEMIPWKLNSQWLTLLAKSGTPLFISFKKGSLTSDQEKDVMQALEIASKVQPLAEPIDWFDTKTPKTWDFNGEVKTFDWNLK